MENHQKKQIGQILIEQKIITQKHLDQALFIQSYNHKKIGEILVELGYIGQRQLNTALTIQNSENLVA